MKPGIYRDLSNADYHASEGLSSSTLKKLLKSGAHYQASLSEEESDSTQKRFGSIVHAMLLQPDQVKDLIHVGEYNTRRGKEFDKALEQGAGKLVCNREEYDRAQACAEAFRNQAIEHPYLNGQKYKLLEGIKEASFYWQDTQNGVLLKAKPDCITPTGVIVDIKTCEDASPDGFQKAIGQFGYHLSAAHYLRVVNEVMIQQPVEGFVKPTQFVFICIESKAPFAMVTYFLSTESLDLGHDEAQTAIRNYVNGVTTGKWEAYPKELTEISLPRWYSFKSAANRGGK